MYCTKCGKQIPDGSKVCMYCGNRLGGGSTAYAKQGGIDNIFSALVHRRTPGVIAEFSMWCAMCLAVLMFLIAAIVGKGDATWLLSMFVCMGLGVLMALRLRSIFLYSAIIGMHFIMFNVLYIDMNVSVGVAFISGVIFFLVGAVALAGVVIASINVFSKFRLGTVSAILSITTSSLIFIFTILMYAIRPALEKAGEALGGKASDVAGDVLGLFGSGDAVDEFSDSIGFMTMREGLNHKGYWIGIAAFWIVLIVIALFHGFYQWGFIDKSDEKFIKAHRTPQQNLYVGSGNAKMQASSVGIYGMSGANQGKMYPISGNGIVIGSAQQANVWIADPSVSHNHCTIRFNPSTSRYEVYDTSINGVYLSNGQRLQAQTITAVPRGAVICIANRNNQFKLL